MYLRKMKKLENFFASLSKMYLSEKMESLDWRSMIAVSYGVGEIPEGNDKKLFETDPPLDLASADLE